MSEIPVEVEQFFEWLSDNYAHLNGFCTDAQYRTMRDEAARRGIIFERSGATYLKKDLH